MNKKTVTQFLLWTFALVLVASAGEYIIARTWGGIFAVDESSEYSFSAYAVFGIIAATIGALTPAIASYIVLKKNGNISGLKEWLKNVFYVKSSIFHYAFVVLWLALYFVIHISISGLTQMMPLYMFFLFLPLTLLAGGMEEAGWSYILQPELNKKYSFFVSSVITGVIWWAWHIPLFFIPGTSHYEIMSIWMFLVACIGMRFFYGAILKISGKAGIFLSVLKHTLYNALAMTFVFMPTTWTATIVALIIMFFVSVIPVIIYNKKMQVCTK